MFFSAAQIFLLCGSYLILLTSELYYNQLLTDGMVLLRKPTNLVGKTSDTDLEIISNETV